MGESVSGFVSVTVGGVCGVTAGAAVEGVFTFLEADGTAQAALKVTAIMREKKRIFRMG